MNTQEAAGARRSEFNQRVFELMFEDGFGPDEAISFAEDYALEIFGNKSATAVGRIKTAIRRITT